MKNSNRIIQLVRSVGPTSMPWNDLYPIVKKQLPGQSHMPMVVNSLNGNFKTKFYKTGLRKYRFVQLGVIAALIHIVRIQKRCLKHNRKLVIHVHNPSLALIAVFAKLASSQTQIVVNLHNEWNRYKLHQRLAMYLLTYVCTHLITVSDSIRRSLPPSVLARLSNAEKVTAIPNGVYPNILNCYFEISNRPNTAVVVARMVPQKNCLFILEILKNTPSIERLVWIGKGYQGKMISNAVKKMGLTKRIDFVGVISREAVYEIMGKSNVYISASLWEGIGVANIEAAMLGCQPFLSSIGPHMEIANNLKLKTFSLENIQEWSNDINKYLAISETERSKIRCSIQANVKQNYDFNINGLKYIDVYKNL